jgi:diacylglycerol kinase family enzyme
LGLEHSKTLRASTMDLEIFAPAGGAPLAAQLDGEEWPASQRVRIEVVPRSLRLIIPAT